MWVAGDEQHDQTDDTDEVEADHNDATGLEFVGEVAGGEAEEAGDHVRGDGHELGFFVAVAEIADDGGEEEAEGVD